MAIPKNTSERVDGGRVLTDDEYALQQITKPASENESLQAPLGDTITHPTPHPNEEGASAPEERKKGLGGLFHKNKKDPVSPYESEYDVEKGVLKPFGDTRAPKRKANTNHFDPRKNTNRRNFLIRTVTIVSLFGVMGLGAYNAAFPPDVPTEQDIASIAKKATNNTKFPRSRARMFVENYMTAYVRVNADAESAKLLGYYTSGDEKNDSTTTSRSYSGAVNQYDVVSVKSDDGTAVNDNTATFLVTTYVKPSVSNTNSLENRNNSSNDKVDEGKWLSFRVSVFWDEKTNGFAIAGDPAVLPGMNIISSENIPQARELGQADSSATKDVQPVVLGYLKAYAKSSPKDTSDLQQYVVPNPKPNLLTGFGGKLSFGSGSNSNDGVQLTAYVPEGSSAEDASTLKVRATVDWVDTVEGATGDGTTQQPRITYKSTYVLTLQKQENGKYLVSDMIPDVYVPDPAALKEYQGKK